MTATAEKKKSAAVEEKSEDKVAGEKLAPAIAKGVLRVLGKPPNLSEVRVHHLWDNRFRVNVWGEVFNNETKITSFRITDSFFIHASPEGDITYSSPVLVKRYKNE